jgi:hypothetical protein
MRETEIPSGTHQGSPFHQMAPSLWPLVLLLPLTGPPLPDESTVSTSAVHEVGVQRDPAAH